MKKRSILIVGGSAGVRRELESVVNKNCHFEVVVTVGSPEAAFEASLRIQPDLVIYDLPLTGDSDTQTIRRLRETLPDSGIIAISLFDHYRASALTAGADEFVTKTSPQNELVDAIGRHPPSKAPTA